MKIVPNRFAILCAAFGLASFLNFSAQARVYSDASSDLFDNGLANLDITSVEVTNDASNITFTVTTRSFLDWTKYLIGIRTAAASSSSTTGNAWSRPASYAEGINFQIAAWVDGATPTAQYIAYTSGAWNWGASTTATMDLTQTAANKVSWTVSLASLGLALGDIFKFDVGTSGGDGNGFIDALSTSNLTTTGWGTASTGGALISYTTIDPNADGDLDNDNLQDNWEVTYFSNLTAQDGSGDPDSDTLTNEQEETAGTDPTKPDTDGDGWLDGVDTTPLVADDVTQNVTFKVDMSVQIFKGAFLAGTDMIYVVGDFGSGNIWNTTANLLTDIDSDGVYEGTVAVSSLGLANVGFKYLIGGKTPEVSGYENGSDRTLVAAPAGTPPAERTLTTVSFANASATREVEFQVDVSVAQASGVFDPATDTVEVVGTFSNNFGTGYALSAPDANGVCSLTTFIDGAENTAINYKFRIKRGIIYTWESDPDRTFNLGAAYVVGGSNAPQILTADYFNRTGQSRSLTFVVDMGVQITKGLFADGDTLEVRYGDFNAAGKALVKEGSTTVYSGTFVVPGNADTVLQYKYWKMNAATITPFERLDAPRGNNLLNRTYTLGSSGVAATITPTPYFGNDEGVGPVLTLTGASTVNLNVGDTYTDLGATANDAVEGTVTAIPSGTVDTNTAGIYTVTYNANDANGNAATPVTRTVVVSAVGSTFAGWSGGATLDAANLAKYAIGGASSLSVEGVQPTSALDGTSLSITAIARTDDPTHLTVVGQAVTNLLDYATPGLVVEVVGDATGIDQAGVPVGCTKKKFSVPRAGDGRKFLRLNAALSP